MSSFSTSNTAWPFLLFILLAKLRLLFIIFCKYYSIYCYFSAKRLYPKFVVAECLVDEFQCLSNSECIELGKRCDNIYDCLDHSDEFHCICKYKNGNEFWVSFEWWPFVCCCLAVCFARLPLFVFMHHHNEICLFLMLLFSFLTHFVLFCGNIYFVDHRICTFTFSMIFIWFCILLAVYNVTYAFIKKSNLVFSNFLSCPLISFWVEFY